MGEIEESTRAVLQRNLAVLDLATAAGKGEDYKQAAERRVEEATVHAALIEFSTPAKDFEDSIDAANRTAQEILDNTFKPKEDNA